MTSLRETIRNMQTEIIELHKEMNTNVLDLKTMIGPHLMVPESMSFFIMLP